MSDAIAIRRAIHGKLRGDMTLTGMLGSPPAGYSKATFDDLAPTAATFPYVIVSQSSSVPRYALGARAMDDELWLIKGVDHSGSVGEPGTADKVDGIATRLNALLTDGTISIAGATQLYLRRESAVRYAEQSDGSVYRHAGHLFRLVYS